MSFILDALRKSENERRLEAAPDIIRGPVAVRRDRMPTWAIFTLGGLSAALVSLSIFVVLDRGNAPVPTATSAPETRIVQSVQSQSPSIAATNGPERTRSVESPALDALAVEPPAIEKPGVGTPAVATAARETPAVRQEAAPVPTVTAIEQQDPDVGRLPAYASAVAEGLSIGVLQMQLHVHSSTPSNRFVVVNGRRYREGETLTEGPVVESIVAEGAVLRVSGRQYLLTAN